MLRCTYVACFVQNMKSKVLSAVTVQNTVLSTVTSYIWLNIPTLLSVFKICTKYTNIYSVLLNILIQRLESLLLRTYFQYINLLFVLCRLSCKPEKL